MKIETIKLKNNIITPELNERGQALRHIRSFVRRQGRLTPRQQQALEKCWSQMGIDYHPALFDFEKIFQRTAPVTLEIGFGMGQSFVEMAIAASERNFLGIEVHLPGVGACLALADEQGVSNIRVMCHDAVEVLVNSIPEQSLDRVQLYFPDPWHKVRHNKRRIVQPEFAELVREKLAIGGIFHMATDWVPYAEHMRDVMSGLEHYRNLSETGDYVPRPDFRPLTKFESRGHRLGHGVWDLMFERIK